MQNILTLGVDIGSSASKCILMRDGSQILAKSLVPVGAGTSGPEKAIADIFRQVAEYSLGLCNRLRAKFFSDSQ
ncbi:TPA: hypothetical protein ACN60V_001132 [Escherichia albertii]